MNQSFGTDNVRMFLGDGNTLLRDVVGHKKADIVIVDTPFTSDILQKFFMLSSVAHSVKDDGVIVLFENETGWDETIGNIQDYYHVFDKYYLVKNRFMKTIGRVRTDRNIMAWMTPKMVDHRSNWFKFGYTLAKNNEPGKFLEKDWSYNSSDKLGQAAGCTTLHRGTKSLGIAGFILQHITSHLRRDDILVVDPYGGSGTFAIASQLLGLKCISSEIDAVTYTNAEKKFKYSLNNSKDNPYWFRQAIKTVETRVTRRTHDRSSK